MMYCPRGTHELHGFSAWLLQQGVAELLLLLPPGRDVGVAGPEVADVVRLVEHGADPVDTERVHHAGQRVGLDSVDPGAAEVDRQRLVGACADRVCEGAAADVIGGLEDDDLLPEALELARRGQAGKAGADDDRVVA